MENIKQQLEEVIKKNLPEKKEGCPFNCNDICPHTYGDLISLSKINTSLIADEVIKVLVEKMVNGLKDIPWANRNECENEKVICENEVLELLSNLSPNKENKNNENI